VAAAYAAPGGAITDQQINALVEEREKFRASKDWAEADRIREQLRGYGVEVSDKEKAWRSNDGRHGAIILGTTLLAAAGGCAMTDEQINAKINEREDARRMKDWGAGDRIREELRAVGCEVNDREKVWRTTDGRRGRVGGGAAPVMSMGSTQIEQLIQERQQAREMKDYARSDELREQLRAQGIQVHDKEGIWQSSDGRTGILSGYVAASLPRPAHARLAPLPLPLGNHGPCRAPLRLCVPAVRRRALAKTANTCTHARTRACSACRQQMGGGGMGGGPLNEQQINALIQQREQARAMKDWTTGDRIRDQLRQSGIDIFDREKYWRARDGRQGMIGNVGGGGGGMGGGMGGGYGQQQQAYQQQAYQQPQYQQQQQQQQVQYTPEQIAAYHQQYYAQQQQQQQQHY